MIDQPQSQHQASIAFEEWMQRRRKKKKGQINKRGVKEKEIAVNSGDLTFLKVG